jgi:hypothetical protein
MFKQLLESIKQKINRRYRVFRSAWRNRSVTRKWRNSGSPYPAPHEYRQEVIKSMAARYKIDTLVECGTAEGRMPEALQDFFTRIYSIELNIDRYLNAKERFYNIPHIEIIKGESSEQLKLLLSEFPAPVLFWLDTHAWIEKGLTQPSTLKELEAILSSGQNHVVLINDARLFTGDHGYPSLIAVRNFIAAIRAEYHFKVENDIIRVIPGDMVPQL